MMRRIELVRDIVCWGKGGLGRPVGQGGWVALHGMNVLCDGLINCKCFIMGLGRFSMHYLRGLGTGNRGPEGTN